MWVLPFYMWFIFKVLEPYEFYPIRHLVLERVFITSSFIILKRRIIGEKSFTPTINNKSSFVWVKNYIVWGCS